MSFALPRAPLGAVSCRLCLQVVQVKWSSAASHLSFLGWFNTGLAVEQKSVLF